MLSRVVIQVSIRRAGLMTALITPRARTLSRPADTGDSVATENTLENAPGRSP
jgi:hypothetical protein